MKPYFIGISGPSCAGKSTVVRELQRRFAHSSVVSLDDFWHNPATFPKVKHARFGEFVNWELPQNLDFTLLHRVLRKLQRAWLMVRHLLPNKTGRPIVLVEGFLLFHDRRIRDLLDLKVYLTIPDHVFLKRRMNRKRFVFKGRELYYRDVVLKEYRRHGLPTKRFADLVIDGRMPVRHVADRISAVAHERIAPLDMTLRRLAQPTQPETS